MTRSVERLCARPRGNPTCNLVKHSLLDIPNRWAAIRKQYIRRVQSAAGEAVKHSSPNRCSLAVWSATRTLAPNGVRGPGIRPNRRLAACASSNRTSGP
jgi:hypothetical protein